MWGIVMSEIEEFLKKFVVICKKYLLFGSFNIVNDLDNVFLFNLFCLIDVDYLYKNYNFE